jgi:hypothetical protein
MLRRRFNGEPRTFSAPAHQRGRDWNLFSCHPKVTDGRANRPRLRRSHLA